MRVLYSTHTSPDYIPPLVISEQQIVVGPKYPRRIEDGVVRSLNVAPGRYDLAALVSSLPVEQRPDLTVVLADAYQNCVPEKLASVPGRKLLLLADTHHGIAPLQKMLAYARQEPFDHIIVTHDPHHLHWFAEADVAPTTYIPNINCSYFPQRLIVNREPSIIFVGQAGQLHPRRQHFLHAIQNAGLPLVVRQVPAPMAATMYNSTQITFNCSLNGDLNMRVFEVMAAGGFLVTDRLSPQSGLETLFRRGKEYVDYESLDDLLNVLRYYLAHPAECLKIAKAGRKAYLREHRPTQRVCDLLEFVSGKSAGPSFKNDLRAAPNYDGFGENLEERIRLYELLQNLSLQSERVIVLADATLGARVISDFVDLPRLKVCVTKPTDESSRIKELLNGFGVLNQIDFIISPPAQCDIQLLHVRTLTNRREKLSVSAQWLAVMTDGNPMQSQIEWLTCQGFTKITDTPLLFQRAH